MTRLLSLAAGTLAEFGPADTVRAAADAGFDAAGIWFDADEWTPAVATEVRRRLDDTGLIALDMEPVMLSPDGDHGEALVDAAVALGVRYVLVASLDDDHHRVAIRLGQLADRLGDSAVRLVLEFLPSLGVRTLGDAASIVGAVARPEVGILIDNLHLARSGATPGDIALFDPNLFPYLQICDAAAAPAEPGRRGLLDEALHHRLLPGQGALPLDACVDAVPAVPLSFEIRSKALRAQYPDATDRARAVWATARRWR